jgi:hypothetical protein
VEVSGVFEMHTEFSFFFQKRRKVNQKCLVLPHCSRRRKTDKKIHDPKVLRFFFAIQYSDDLRRWTSRFRNNFMSGKLFHSLVVKVYEMEFLFGVKIVLGKNRNIHDRSFDINCEERKSALSFQTEVNVSIFMERTHIKIIRVRAVIFS